MKNLWLVFYYLRLLHGSCAAVQHPMQQNTNAHINTVGCGRSCTSFFASTSLFLPCFCKLTSMSLHPSHPQLISHCHTCLMLPASSHLFRVVVLISYCPFWITTVSPISCHHAFPISDHHPSLANRMSYVEALIRCISNVLFAQVRWAHQGGSRCAHLL